MKNNKSRILDPQTDPFERLVLTMAYLRSENGCAWDKQQTHVSLLPYLIEETYELVEALESDDSGRIKEELGDLLCQIVFHAQIGTERGRFTISDSLKSITEKLIERHPHIFKDEKGLEPKEVRQQWEQIKLKKKSEKGESVLAGLPTEMPALLMAFRMGEKAGGIGFDWKKPEDVLEKIEEETLEIKNEMSANDRLKLSDEIGDLLFAVASLARKLGINPEHALRQSLRKFRGRFEKMEKEVDKHGRKLYNLQLEEMDRLWNEIKSRES